VDQLIDWVNPNNKRRAGISAFGFTGTIAHTIFEEVSSTNEAADLPALPFSIITLSAKGKNALRKSVCNIEELIKTSQEEIHNISCTSNIIRSSFEHRFSIAVETREDALKNISDCLNNNDKYMLHTSHVKSFGKKKIAFLFTGQGSIYEGVAKQFYETSEPFKQMLDLCNEKFKEILGFSLISKMYGSEEELQRPIVSQPAIFSIEYALTQVWNRLGIFPDVVIGHSIGEYAAACYAGLLSLDDAVKLISERGKLMDSIETEGKMVGVLTNRQVVENSIMECGCANVSIAAINAPQNITISGISQDVDDVISLIQNKERVFVNKLNISHPFHSVIMKKYEEKYQNAIGEISFSALNTKMISSITGKLEDVDILGDKRYWIEHLSNTVHYQKAIEEAQKFGVTVFIEMGGDATLAGLAEQCIGDSKSVFLPSLRKGTSNYKQLFESVSSLFLNGIEIDWKNFYKTYHTHRAVLPNYPFQRKRSWKELNEHKEENIMPVNSNSTNNKPEKSLNLLDIQKKLKRMINLITGFDISDIEEDLNLLSFGFDSLKLTAFSKKIDEAYKLNISLGMLFDSLDTVEKISEHIENNLDVSTLENKYIIDEHKDESKTAPDIKISQEDVVKILSRPVIKMSSSKESGNSDLMSIQSFFKDQREIISEQIKIISEQNKIINSIFVGGYNLSSAFTEETEEPKPSFQHNEDKNKSKRARNRITSFGPYTKLNLERNTITDEMQHIYSKSIESKYLNMTKQSKIIIEKYRNVYADNRNIASFKPQFKEMIFQIVMKSSKGSRFIDVDGNELVDISMGFGVHLFGHNPDFIKQAMSEVINDRNGIGPDNMLSGEVAFQITELTGVERVSFFTTGTEANMVALRLAKTVTKKKKIVMFSGSFHGSFDGLLGMPSYSEDNDKSAIPVAPGISESMLKDLWILDYGDNESLDFIDRHYKEIAAVLVEPVQSRFPSLQPVEFLHTLRALTLQRNITLIFDEIITGFRILAGGAQQYFGVQADIVTYGKIIGGGLPIGIVCGRADYLDGIDGGMWNYGDDSLPPAEGKMTLSLGTFSHHPLAMSAADAVLKYIAKHKHTLYNELNGITEDFVEEINTFFINEDIPILINGFGSLFRFKMDRRLDIFYFGLIEKGVYLWEGRNCFFSTEHSAGDIQKVADAIKCTALEMKGAGFFKN